jgi:hypothetical protein
VHAADVEALPALSFGALAVTIEIELAVVGVSDVVPRRFMFAAPNRSLSSRSAICLS